MRYYYHCHSRTLHIWSSACKPKSSTLGSQWADFFVSKSLVTRFKSLVITSNRYNEQFSLDRFTLSGTQCNSVPLFTFWRLTKDTCRNQSHNLKRTPYEHHWIKSLFDFDSNNEVLLQRNKFDYLVGIIVTVNLYFMTIHDCRIFDRAKGGDLSKIDGTWYQFFGLFKGRCWNGLAVKPCSHVPLVS